MTLGANLAAVIAAFAAILTGVMWMAFRERRVAQRLAPGSEAEHASDARVMLVIFAAIPAGMVLTLIVAWLVFL
jgi:hypothetical protein